MKNSRLIWLYSLVLMTALTAVCQYIVQGWMAANHSQPLPDWFWWADSALWGLRAFIEAGVICFAFTTRPSTRAQEIILWAFEALLVILITLTLGPVLRALGMGVPLREAMGEPAFSLWNFLMAAYNSAMIGASGYAYRVQPLAEESAGEAEELKSLRSLRDDLTKETEALNSALKAATQKSARLPALEVEIAELRRDLSDARMIAQNSRALALLPPRKQAAIIAYIMGEEKPAADELAAALGASGSTIRRGYDEAEARNAGDGIQAIS